MNMHFVLPMIRRSMLGLALCLVATTVAANQAFIQVVQTHSDEAFFVLKRDSEIFANAYQKMLKEEQLPITNRGLNKLRPKIYGATIAHMIYTYEKDGREVSRTYYARSGPAMRVVYDRATHKESSSRGETPSPSSGSSGQTPSSSGSSEYVPTSADVTLDANESKYYPEDTDAVRAPNLPVERSALQPIVPSGLTRNIHDADAELKIFRQIEVDIDAEIVPKGGKLTGFVSKAVCASCLDMKYVMETQFGISGKLEQLVEPEKLNAGEDPAIEKSKEVSDRLKKARKEFVEEAIHPDKIGSTVEPTPMVEQGQGGYRPGAIEGGENDELRVDDACVDGI